MFIPPNLSVNMDEGTFSYRPHIVDSALKRKLRGKGAVLIEGPRWCGKTTTAEQVSKSILSTDDPSTIDANRTLSEIDPERLLTGNNRDSWMNGRSHPNCGMR